MKEELINKLTYIRKCIKDERYEEAQKLAEEAQQIVLGNKIECKCTVDGEQLNKSIQKTKYRGKRYINANN